MQLIYKQNKDADVLIQEYIKTDGDVRVVIAGSDIIGTMKREVVEGDFRSNYTQGAEQNHISYQMKKYVNV